MIQRIKYIIRGKRYLNKIDPDEIGYIRSVLNEGDIAVDLGAHKGGYLYWIYKGIGKTGHVYAFEPQQILFKYLKRIERIMGYRNLTIENKGISSKKGVLRFYIPKTKSGISPTARIDLLENENDYVKTEIEVTTLDQYFFERNIFPQFIKIDVEGHEADVLSGGLKLLKHCNPKIVMECESRHLKSGTIGDVFQILLDLGYKGYFFKNGQLKSLDDFDIKKHQAVHEGRYWEDESYINNFVFE